MKIVSRSPHLPAEQVTVDRATYKVTESRSVVDIDRDLPWHGGRWPRESWSIVSNLDSGGQRLGFQVHFLMQHLPTGATLAALNVSVVDETSGMSRNFEYCYPLDQVEISEKRLRIYTPELKLSADRYGFAMILNGERAQISVSATAFARPMLMNGQGQCVLLDVNEQYEFALPSMVTSGIVVLEGMIYEVDGISWLDRQWGGLPRFFADPFTIGVDGFSSMNWIRSNAQLDNGVNIALAQVRDMHDHKIYLALTAVHPDGTHIVVPAIDPVEAGDYWTSPVTGRRYPTRCVFRATQIHTELIVEVPFKEQEIVSSVSAAFTKFQGAATITGTYQGLEVFGRGYLELVGNWSCPPQPPIATRLAG